jgi:alpha-ketoglutarate-dependent taurine dioxygenase
MSEEGRTVVEGTTYVLYTNTKYKTGGAFERANFHTENYFVPDVPRFIAFCCLTPSWMGGETGLVNTAKLYEDLPGRLQQSLMARTVTSREYRIAEIAARYQLAPGHVREFCERVGLPIVTRDGVEHVAIHKPSVIEHPVTHERMLVINFGGPLTPAGFAPRVNEAFAGDYRGWPWAMHRFHWKHPSVLSNVSLLGGLVTRPRDAWPYLGFKLRTMFRKPAPPPRRATGDTPSLADLFADRGDVETLARAMRRRFSSFTWKPGDVLLLDNLKMAHGGMPGFGPRNLKALICNCLALPTTQGPGLFAPGDGDVRECFGAQLLESRLTWPVSASRLSNPTTSPGRATSI